MSGDGNCANALTSLLTLWLSNTQMTGDFGNLRALTDLQHLCPDACITGQPYMQTTDAMSEGGYREAGYDQVSLQELWLGDTQVTGDSASWNALASLQHPGLRR